MNEIPTLEHDAIMQLFIRSTENKNEYVVCGLIKTKKPYQNESVHVITTDCLTNYECKDIHDISEGQGLDNLMCEPIWRKFV